MPQQQCFYFNFILPHFLIRFIWVLFVFFLLLVPAVVLSAPPSGDDKCVDSSSPGRSDAELVCIFNTRLPNSLRNYLSSNRDKQNLSGNIVLELTILPSGQLKKSWLIASDVPDPDFVNTVLDVIAEIDFGSKKVDEVTTEFTIKFVQGVPFLGR